MQNLKNTSRYPNSEVEQLVKAAISGVRMDDVQINVKNSNFEFAGRAWPRVPPMSPFYGKARYLITVRVGHPDHFPCLLTGKYKRVPEVWAANWQEALVYVAAHEARHIEQFRNRLPRSEVSAERFGIRKLREYVKKTHGEPLYTGAT